MRLEDALRNCEDGFLSNDDVAELCRELGGSEAEILDQVSVEVAERYLAGERTFEVADTFMNSVWGFSLTLERIPPLMFKIYEAFDAGEYPHSADAPGVDSEAKYTRPILERLLSGWRAT